MKFKNYRKDTYKICMKYVKEQNHKTEYQLIKVLEKWLKCKRDGELEDYGYTGDFDTMLLDIKYCADRMNMGRAKAILRLLEEHGSL